VRCLSCRPGGCWMMGTAAATKLTADDSRNTVAPIGHSPADWSRTYHSKAGGKAPGADLQRQRRRLASVRMRT
jgi:hypothetical protein